MTSELDGGPPRLHLCCIMHLLFKFCFRHVELRSLATPNPSISPSMVGLVSVALRPAPRLYWRLHHRALLFNEGVQLLLAVASAVLHHFESFDLVISVSSHITCLFDGMPRCVATSSKDWWACSFLATLDVSCNDSVNCLLTFLFRKCSSTARCWHSKNPSFCSCPC